MPSALKERFQPNPDNLESGFKAHHPLAERKHIRVVVLPAQPRGVRIPAERAPDAFDAIGDHRLAVARAAQNNAAIEFAPRPRLGPRPHEERIIDRFLGMRPKIRDVVAETLKEIPDLVFVLEAGVVRTNGNSHLMHFPELSLPRRTELRQPSVAPVAGHQGQFMKRKGWGGDGLVPRSWWPVGRGAGDEPSQPLS